MSITIALAGNPNCGKTTLFNEITGSRQHVGNWPGVTVEKKEGIYRKDKAVSILDLPGTYSLSPYSAEEIVARDYIVKEKPDAVVNIVDGTSIERNLYLTVQLMETGIPMVIAMNMMDEVEGRGDRIDCNRLSRILGVPVVPVVARTGKGLEELMEAAVTVARSGKKPDRPDIFEYELAEAIQLIADALGDGECDESKWRAVKLAERDEIVGKTVPADKKEAVEALVNRANQAAGGDAEAAIADSRYQYIGKAVKECVRRSGKDRRETWSDKLDRILTNRILALPVFAGIMYLLFACTFSENFLFIPGLPSPGVWLAGIVEEAWGGFAEVVTGIAKGAGASEWAVGLVSSCLDGIGAVFGFLPLVLVLFLLMSFLEDSGYMARVAFVMDKLLRKIGLSGRSFVPMLIGFGCSVPAIMATRTLSSDRDRKMTIILTPFMSCSAKLPIYAVFTAAFFPRRAALVMILLYVMGMVVAILYGLLLKATLFRGQPVPFVMELPAYRLPAPRSILLHMWEKAKDFIRKAFTVIFLASLVIWFLQTLDIRFNVVADSADSMLASVGALVAPMFAPLGFGDWRASTALITGLTAKEAVVSTLAVLMGAANQTELQPLLASLFTPAAAFSFLTFTLLYMPCVAAFAAVRREYGSTLKAVGIMAAQTGVAWCTALLVYHAALMIL